MSECIKCGFWDSDREGCTCPHSDRWYACPVESIIPENKKKFDEWCAWLSERKEE